MDIEIGESDSLSGQLVDSRGWNRIPLYRNISPTPIIDEDVNDIRLICYDDVGLLLTFDFQGGQPENGDQRERDREPSSEHPGLLDNGMATSSLPPRGGPIPTLSN